LPSAIQPPSPDSPLARRLGPFDAAAIVVSNAIGGGIFFVPIVVAGMVTDAPAALGMWLAGGALVFAGSMAYAELAALRPRAGGEYVYLREAYGPLAGFLTGWTSFVAGFSGAIATDAVALAEYVGHFLPAAAGSAPLLAIPLPLFPLAVTAKSLVALGTIAALTAVHVRGLGPGRVVQNGLTAAKVAGLAALIVVGFALGRGQAAHLAPSHAPPSAALLLSLVPIMFTYSGWNAAAYVAEEVRSPERDVPLALGIGTATVVALYLLLNALYFYALPVAEVAAPPGGRLIDTVAERLFGFAAGDALAAFAIVSIAASISAMVLAGPRVYFAMARDGLFARGARRVHPRFRAPTSAIVAQTIWSGILVLSGTLSELVSYTGFAVVLFSAATVSAVFVLRRHDGGRPRPFSAWGYPWAPALFVAVSAAMAVNEIWRSPKTAVAGLAVRAAGLPVYWWMRRSSAPRASGAPATRR
jgi:APA family basic amino acid/polyamine antiporter